MKEQDKTLGKELNKMKIRHILDKELKSVVVKMLTSFGRRMNELSKNFNKEIENIKKEHIRTEEYSN